MFTDLSLAQRLERNEALATADFAHNLARLDPESGARVVRASGGYVTFMRPGYPVNKAVGLGMDGPVSETDLDHVEAFYRDFHESVRVDLCPLADASLRDELGRRDYRIRQFLNVHVRPLHGGETFPPPPPAFKLTEAGPGDVDLWALTAAQGFTGKDSIPPDDITFPLAQLALNRPSVTGFLAWVEGEPAGAAALAIRDGLATLFFTSVRPAFRRRGIQAALIAARLARAAASGCDLAAVSAVPGSASARSVERADFRVVYTRATMIREWT